MKYKYEKYDYNFLNPVINLGNFYSEGIIESATYDDETNAIHINYKTILDRITIDVNLSDLIDKKANE